MMWQELKWENNVILNLFRNPLTVSTRILESNWGDSEMNSGWQHFFYFYEPLLSIQYSYTIFSIVMNPPLYEAETVEIKWVKLTICCDISNFPDTIYSIYKNTNQLILTIYYKSPISNLTRVWEINTHKLIWFIFDKDKSNDIISLFTDILLINFFFRSQTKNTSRTSGQKQKYIL